MSNLQIMDKEAIGELNRLLSLPATTNGHDWDIEMANDKRLPEFIEYYKTQDLSSNQRSALMALIFASFDKYLAMHDNEPGEHWTAIRDILNESGYEHRSLLYRWGLTGEKGEPIPFHITPYIRQYLSHVGL